MKTTFNLYQFRQAFNDMGRGDQFSYEGLEVLFDYLEQYENETGEEVELDVIALCCEYSEETPEEIGKNYSLEWVADYEDEDEKQEAVIEWLNDHSFVCGVTDSGTIVYEQF